MRSQMSASADLASRLVNKAAGRVELRPNPHRFAAFHVLRRAEAPAVLFEAGYLSNADDELLLRDPAERVEDRACARPGDRSRRRVARPALSQLPACVPNRLDAAPNEVRAPERPRLAAARSRRLQRARARRSSIPWWGRRWVRLARPGLLRRCSRCSPRCGSISRAGCRRRRRCSPTSRRCRPMSAAMTATPVQTFARERRVELSYDEYPPLVVHAFISAEDKDFFSHHGIDYPGPDRRGGRLFDQERHRRRARQGRIDDHPAGRQISAQGFELQCRPQGARGDPRLPARSRR